MRIAPLRKLRGTRDRVCRLIVGCALCASGLAQGQSCELPAGGVVVANADATLRLTYRLEPVELKTDRHFALLVAACAPSTIDALTVDAQMPEHRHGMNYKPVVTQVGPNRWKAEGLLLHMPGRWEFRFDMRSAGRTDRLAHSVIVE